MKNNKPTLIIRLVVLCVALVLLLLLGARLLTRGYDGLVLHYRLTPEQDLYVGTYQPTTLPASFVTATPQPGSTQVPLQMLTSDTKEEVLMQVKGENIDTVTCSVTTYDIHLSGFYMDGEDEIIVTFTGDAGAIIPKCQLENGMLSIVQESTIGTTNKKGTLNITVPIDKVKDCSIYTVSGKTILNMPPDTMLFESTSGDLTISDGGSGKKLQVNTVSGEIYAGSPYESLTLNSTSGSFLAVADENSKSVECNTVSGDLTLKLSEKDNYSMNYSGVSGKAEDSYSGQTISRSGKLARGEQRLTINVSATSGSVYLKDWR